MNEKSWRETLSAMRGEFPKGDEKKEPMAEPKRREEPIDTEFCPLCGHEAPFETFMRGESCPTCGGRVPKGSFSF